MKEYKKPEATLVLFEAREILTGSEEVIED